jgi:hypothetical protein
MRVLECVAFAVAVVGIVLGSLQAAEAAGSDGCNTCFGRPNGGGPGYLCVASECVYAGESCAHESGPYGIQCGCGEGATYVAPCVLEADWSQSTGWNIQCHDWSCPDDCPDAVFVSLPQTVWAWACPCP